MAKIKKSVISQNLAGYRVLIEDASPASEYFKLSEIPDSLTGGKNAFLINGSNALVPTTEVKVELIDSEGKTVFAQPIRNYQEGLARIVSMEVYEDTPLGLATLVVMGEARSYIDGTPIPPEWQGKYNVRWKRQIAINPSAINSSKIRLYQTPTLAVSEILSPFRNATISSTVVVSGSGLLNVVGSTGPTSSFPSYIVRSADIPFVGAMAGGTLTAPAYNYSGSVIKVINSSSLQVDKALLPNNTGFATTPVSLSFQSAPVFAGTALTRSFADVRLSKLTTFSGDVNRAKIYVKSIDQTGDYELLEDIQLESIELLTTTSVNYGENTISYGYFRDQQLIDDYWWGGFASSTGYTQDNSVVPIYVANRLIDAAKLDIPGLVNSGSLTPQYFFGIKTPILFGEAMEYTFQGTFVCEKNSSAFPAQMDVYASGSAFPSNDPLGVKLKSYTVPVGQVYKLFESSEFNFVGLKDGTADLNFVIYGGEWHFSNLSINSSTETGFNPDEISLVCPLFGRRYEQLQFKAELFDPNSNLVNVNIESSPVLFDGGNIVFKGLDHRIEGQISIIPSGANPALTSIKLTTDGFFDTGSVFRSGSSIQIGYGHVFNKDTPFIVATDLSGSPQIAIGDKLHGYIDSNTGEFVLRIIGSLLIGSGSNFIDIRSLLPRSPKDVIFARVTAQVGDFYDLRGRYAVSSGEWNDQIARTGNYTRSNHQPVLQPVVTAPDIIESYDAFATSSIVYHTSCSIVLDPSVNISNNTIYMDGSLLISELSSSVYYGMTYSTEVLASWTGYPSPSGFGQQVGGDTSINVVVPGVVVSNAIVNFPIAVPTPRVGNTLYIVVTLRLTSAAAP